MKNIIAIIKDVDKLRDRCDEINAADVFNHATVKQVSRELRDTIKHYKNITALSAPQLGYKYRIFCIKFNNNEIRTFVNPLIMTRDKDKMHLSREHQIGLSEDTYLVPRSSVISAVFQTPMGNNEACEFNDSVASVFQQMCDLLDGVLISDFGLKIDDDFDKASEEERQEVVKYYLEHLKDMGEKVKETIDNDPIQSAIDETITQLTKMNLGKAEFVKIDDDVKEQIKKEFEEREKQDASN